MNNGTSGSYRTRRELAMRAFDKLPAELRCALADSVDNWVPQPLHSRLKEEWPVSLLVRMIRDWNKAELEQREKQRRAARGVYAGNAPDPDFKSRKPKRAKR